MRAELEKLTVENVDGRECQDCEDPILDFERRRKCKRCKKLVCAWCYHHVHFGQPTC